MNSSPETGKDFVHTTLDDVLFTETAFASLNASIDNYDDDAIPTVDNNDASVSLIWPNRARRNDYIYIVGDGFFLSDGSAASGIEKINFKRTGFDIDVAPGDDDDPILLIGSRIIRCKVPLALDSPSGPTTTTVTVYFEFAIDNPGTTFTLDSDA